MARLNDNDFVARRWSWPALLLRWLPRRPRDRIAAGVAALAAISILVNALFLQSGPHPAPIFANTPLPVVAPNTAPVATLLSGRPLSDTAVETTGNAQPHPNMVTDIQRELAQRGFYDGSVDGLYGPKTDAAIRMFERAAGLPPSAEPNDALLDAIRRSSAKAEPARAIRNDPIAALLARNERLTAVQRALADFGYGPIKPTGVYDAQTRAAIERFERARHWPATGKLSEKLVHDLARMTGRSLE